MRRFFGSFGEVLRAMWTHKLRSFLTMFGIAWGVGSLLLLVGLGEGFRAGTTKNLASFGEDFMQIYNGRVPAVGSTILINSVPFEVVGTLQKVGHGNNNGQNMRLIMPYTTMAIYFPMQGAGNAKAIKYVAYQPITRERHEQAKKAVRSIVARN